MFLKYNLFVELQMTVSLESDGKVIVHRQGETWKICAYDLVWDDIAATTVCRMMNNRYTLLYS